ncbi:MAG TPA: FliM/FliN family flagellar motor C-terminal domain-containing protein [Candidatus Angelobacter sp.]|nr:FliM/FliN family flagellar motor C-terminal domain-containing protein [Candidatus Angelobacter sp.]
MEPSALLPPAHGEATEARDAFNPAMKPFPEESPLAGLPMQLDVMIPVPSFRVQDLLSIEEGTVLETGWPYTDDVPVWCGGSQLVWSEFEVIDEKLAVRVTRLG